ncbi:MAG: helix-turn-helix transcriptional regulator [Clostridia bacterium]|nr:helix-turn-helix transcriptional regulator [Clostridia bacterium]
MNIGEIIRAARRERDMTQEQLAEYLNLSVSAVSQWESGRTMPDLGMIPAICNLFGISADRLLGIDLEQREARIKSIWDEAGKYSGRGYYDEARAILEDGLREFPDSYGLMSDLMFIAYWQGQERQEGEARFDEAIRLGEAILAGCTEDNIRHSAIQILCYSYTARGETDRAEALARKMPTICIAQECLMSHIKQGTEGYRAAQAEANDLLQHLEVRIGCMNLKLDDGSRAYTSAERAALNDKLIALLHLLFEEGDFGFYHTHLCGTHREQAAYYAKLGDAVQTLRHLSAAADHAVGFLQWTEHPVPHTSLIFRGSGGYGSFGTGDTDNDAAQVLKAIEHARYEFVRDAPELAAIRERLAPYADKWSV